MRSLEETDLAFIRETYPDPSWTLIQIAEKLDKSDSTVLRAARRMGLSRPDKFQCPNVDWETIWYSYLSCRSYKKVEEQTGISQKAAIKAVRRMKEMTEAERIMRWNRYRVKHDMPLFTKC